MKHLECERVYNPDDAMCLDCGENDETLKQHERCKEIDERCKEIDEKHQILKDEKRREMYRIHRILKNAGLDSESRNCIARNKQLIDVASLAEEDKTFGGLDKDTLNKLACEGRLLEIAQAHANGIMTVEKAHQILKDAGLDIESRSCMVQNNQLVDIASFIEKNRWFGELDNETLNILAKENCLMSVAITLEKYRKFGGFGEFDEDTINKLAKRRANYFLACNQLDKNTINRSLAGQDKTTVSSLFCKFSSGLYSQWFSLIRLCRNPLHP